MTKEELQIFRDVSWDSGWNAALDVAAMMLSSALVREDVTRQEMAKELQTMRVGAARGTVGLT
jgi:hypothetical protein